MDWIWEDNMVDSLFFCAMLTSYRGGHTPFVQAGAETSDASMEVVKPNPCCSWDVHSGWVGGGVGDENVESCRVSRPLRIALVIHIVQCFSNFFHHGTLITSGFFRSTPIL